MSLLSKQIYNGLQPRQQPVRWVSSTTVSTDESVNVVLENGLPHFFIPLPSRRETCMFTVKPLHHTVGDLAQFIMSEDRGVDHVAFFNQDGKRIAKSNSIADLLSTDFHLAINGEKLKVDTSAIGGKLQSATPHELGDARALITRLAHTVQADEYNLKHERELERRIEDVSEKLGPFEELKISIAEDAAKRTRRLTWLGLGAMGLQFGLLARLTWWEYSWDIMEPVTYFVGYGTTMAMYAYYVMTRQEFTFPEVFDREYLKRFYKTSYLQSFDVNHYSDLRDQLADLKSELRRLKDPLYSNLPLQQTAYMVPEHAHDIVARGPPSTTIHSPPNGSSKS